MMARRLSDVFRTLETNSSALDFRMTSGEDRGATPWYKNGSHNDTVTLAHIPLEWTNPSSVQDASFGYVHRMERRVSCRAQHCYK